MPFPEISAIKKNTALVFNFVKNEILPFLRQKCVLSYYVKLRKKSKATVRLNQESMGIDQSV